MNGGNNPNMVPLSSLQPKLDLEKLELWVLLQWIRSEILRLRHPQVASLESTKDVLETRHFWVVAHSAMSLEGSPLLVMVIFLFVLVLVSMFKENHFLHIGETIMKVGNVPFWTTNVHDYFLLLRLHWLMTS